MNKLIIFDCDGVLVDSEIVGNRVYAEILTNLGYPITAEESIRRFTGIDSKAAEKLIFDESGISLPDNLMELVDRAIFKALGRDLLPLMLPVLSHDLLQNVSKCVASNSPRELVLQSLNTTNQHSYFKNEHVFTSSQVKKAKPAPDLFLFAASQMGYEPKDCIVIEDSLAGIQAARAAEMLVIGFLGGTHASFDWYKKRIQNQNLPIANNYQDLISILQVFLNQKGLIASPEEVLTAL